MSAKTPGDDPATDAGEPSSRRHWLGFAAIALLILAVAAVAANADTRRQVADAWRQMITISPVYLAIIAAFKIGQAFFSALTWRNILAAAYPRQPLSLGFVLGVDQGQDALNMVSPVRAGTWAMLGSYALTIRRAKPATLLAVLGVQTIAYAVMSAINYAILALFLPGAVQGRDSMFTRVRDFAVDRPLEFTGIVAALLIAGGFVAKRLRRRVGDLKEQVKLGATILGTPSRYLLLVFLPSLLSVLCRCGIYAALMAAFDIPVTFWTLSLALGAQAVSGAIRVTPGGVGTTQAIDVIALRSYAPTENVTAYSLSGAVINAIASFAISGIALVATLGFSGTISLLRRNGSAIDAKRVSSPVPVPPVSTEPGG